MSHETNDQKTPEVIHSQGVTASEDAPQTEIGAGPGSDMAEPEKSTPAAGQQAGEAVPGRPWLKRDAAGVFRAASPAGPDPVVQAEVEAFEAELTTSYPRAGRSLRQLAVRTFSTWRRLDRLVETSSAFAAGRAPRALDEAGAWADRLTRVLTQLEATNNSKRKAPARDPRDVIADLTRSVQERKS
jgi:hypothetical protein